ncbi:uncharacterized protein LOC122022545 isoform X2 [Zingiber officinale]|uniref:uncharacterized protein LOC122022545 isoform X1 n=1 Tax=Zingiber officinale TaxID=94328 RepID=UPI001C4D5917|nr:uncharacterized protein LOC122022545 isoform X1 [Zingiber officinale]XP_042436510.1 uncharacterized protein LOC122022545 isoform X2 [Zingiber officinale]
MGSNSTPAAVEEFQLTDFNTYLSETITSFTNWDERLKPKIEQYEEVEKQHLCRIDKLRKRLSRHKALKMDYDRILKELEQENELLLSIITDFIDTFRENEPFLLGNDISDESFDDLSSTANIVSDAEKEVEVVAPEEIRAETSYGRKRKKRKRKESTE